jgi:fatty acid desaturase
MYVMAYIAHPRSRIAGVARYLCIVIALVGVGIVWGMRVMLRILLPTRIAFAAIVILLDVLPHVDMGRTVTTKNVYRVAPWWFFALTAGQCYHEQHHARPDIPWHNLRAN